MRIQHYFIDKKIQNALNKANKSKAKNALSQIFNIAIFVDEKTAFNESDFRKLQTSIKLNDAYYNILTYKEKKTSYNEFKGTVVVKNTINWMGNIKSDSVKEFIKQPYDLLIDYTQADTQIKQLIVADINASFKVGNSKKNEKLYDLIIAVNPKEITQFNEELVRYLKILKLI